MKRMSSSNRKTESTIDEKTLFMRLSDFWSPSSACMRVEMSLMMPSTRTEFFDSSWCVVTSTSTVLPFRVRTWMRYSGGIGLPLSLALNLSCMNLRDSSGSRLL